MLFSHEGVGASQNCHKHRSKEALPFNLDVWFWLACGQLSLEGRQRFRTQVKCRLFSQASAGKAVAKAGHFATIHTEAGAAYFQNRLAVARKLTTS